MAKKKEIQNEAPGYINYEDETAAEPSSKWNSKTLQKYWNELAVKQHRAGGHLWTIKEISLLSRLIQEYGSDLTAKLMEYWMKVTMPEIALNFTLFYMTSGKLHQKYLSENEKFTWEA